MSAPTADVLAVLERIRDGWERMDVEQVLACFERSGETVVIGTDAPEYWIGSDAFEGPFRQMGAAFSDARYTWADGEPIVQVDGGVAWATGRLRATLTVDGERMSLDMRTTHVLRQGPEGWRIVQGHYSSAATDVIGY